VVLAPFPVSVVVVDAVSSPALFGQTSSALPGPSKLASFTSSSLSPVSLLLSLPSFCTIVVSSNLFSSSFWLFSFSVTSSSTSPGASTSGFFFFFFFFFLFFFVVLAPFPVSVVVVDAVSSPAVAASSKISSTLPVPSKLAPFTSSSLSSGSFLLSLHCFCTIVVSSNVLSSSFWLFSCSVTSSSTSPGASTSFAFVGVTISVRVLRSLLSFSAIVRSSELLYSSSSLSFSSPQTFPLIAGAESSTIARLPFCSATSDF